MMLGRKSCKGKITISVIMSGKFRIKRIGICFIHIKEGLFCMSLCTGTKHNTSICIGSSGKYILHICSDRAIGYKLFSHKWFRCNIFPHKQSSLPLILFALTYVKKIRNFYDFRCQRKTKYFVNFW